MTSRASLRRSNLAIAIAVTGGFLLAACGSDSTSSDTTPASTADTAADTTAAAVDPLDGTRWTLDIAGLNIPGADKVLPTIAFADGSVSGSAGCNTFAGSYTVTGDSLTIGELAGTRIACGPVETLVETAVFERLGKVAGFQMTPEALTLTDSAGATVLTYAAAPSDVIGAWDVTGYLNADKSGFVSLIVDTQVTAIFGPDGTVAGSSGCNNYSGTYTVDGENITFGPAVSTAKACIEPEGIMEQESGYLAALQSSVTFVNDGSTLTLMNAEGQNTVILTPKIG